MPFVHDPPVVEEAVRRLALAWEAYAGGAVRPHEAEALIV